MDNYDIFHPDLYKNLFRDEISDGHYLGDPCPEDPEDFFLGFLNFNYNRISRRYGCAVRIHGRRSTDAYDIWLDDCARALEKLNNSTMICEFKTAGFLAYWVRRRCVVDEVKLSGPRDIEQVPDQVQLNFMKHANEICAFMIGFHLCLRHQMKNGNRADDLWLDPALVSETAAYMSTKNVSPHSLYLIFRALFSDLRKA